VGNAKAYYNEINPFAAEWLRNLIREGHIAPGDVDERSIEDVRPNDLVGYTQCHFFAGIGGWSRALRLAGWRDDRPVWTGSCPCQPFSAAGKGDGFDDERHLWPAWFHLVALRRPPIIFGEQVASKDALPWVDLVRADLEAAGYAFAVSDLCAAGVGAPHIRQRLWFVADAQREQRQKRLSRPGEGDREASSRSAIELARLRGAGGVVDATCEQVGISGRTREQRTAGGMGDPDGWGCERADLPVRQPRQDETAPLERRPNFWGAVDWIPCADGKARPVEPGTFPLAHGVPARVEQLRAYGNAIVPEVAAEFIEAYREVTNE
jgi:DNA (cytosine-5)-methyltransferase 1